ncbi:MAG: hypothetical protein KDM81_12760 [Verrucomicrobiae bacterium]|nr:hypothetical protein [Verrucomicrobiae bacterium]
MSAAFGWKTLLTTFTFVGSMPAVKALKIMVVLVCASGTLLAGGDKVRGDNGQGDVNQVQVQDPPPFQDSTAVSLLDILFGWLR